MARAWTKLDNAAKIFPANTNLRDTKVFRFACELTQQVDPILLQSALDTTLLAFPLYRSILKRGLFWHYFESSSLKATVSLENRPPCSPLYDRYNYRLLFDVTYYAKRINLEVHHTLSDGTGASHFLKKLVYHYLLLQHPEELSHVDLLDYDASFSQKREDSFNKYYNPKHTYLHKKVAAYRIRGPLVPENRTLVFEGVMPITEALAKAKAHDTTLSVYLTAHLLTAVSQDMQLRHKTRPVVVTVPVNLRPFFPSVTARNFFATMEIGYDFQKSDAFLDVIASVKEQFAKELTTEKMNSRMSHLTSLETNIFARSAPLALKDIVLNAAAKSARNEVTCSLSNLGKVDMPEALAPYIHRFSIMTSSADLQICLCSYKQILTIAITSAFVSTEIPRRFFRQLAQDGIHIGVVSNLIASKENA